MTKNTQDTSFVTGADKHQDNTTYTDNGALSNGMADISLTESWNARISLFFHVVRGFDSERLKKIIDDSLNESMKDTIILLMHLRDCRGGKGERSLFREAYKYINEKGIIDKFYREKLLFLIPEYGRWDDSVVLCQQRQFVLFKDQIDKDVKNMNDLKPVSLLAKWMPSEKGMVDKDMGWVSRYCKVAKISRKQYRQTNSELRVYIDIVERLISSGRWEDINYSKVPSVAFNKLKKAFDNHDHERFDTFLSLVKKGEAKINVGQLYPYELTTQPYTDIVQVQWDSLVEKFGSISGSWVPVCDVSGSMNGMRNVKISPLNVCVGLGLFLAQCNMTPFKDRIITFSEEPTWVNLNGETGLDHKMKTLINSSWGMNTNVLKMFKLVLDIAVKNKLEYANIPGLVIFSDMQFDTADRSNETNLAAATRIFKEAGYPSHPKLVFWNLSPDTIDFPATTKDENVCLVSGYSPALVKSFMNKGDLSVKGMVQDILTSDRYKSVLDVFKLDKPL